MPSRPDVEVYCPTTLFVGRPATVEVRVTAKEDTKIDFIDVSIVGKQGWRVPSGDGKSYVQMKIDFPELATRVKEMGTLPAGESRFPTSFTLPIGTAPSHAISPAWGELQLRVHVSIPWWPDGRYRFTLPVRLPPPAAVQRLPLSARSTADPDEPRLELSLASTRLIAGETVVGSLALFHFKDRKEREVKLAIVPRLLLHGRGRVRERDGKAWHLEVKVPAGSAGASVPFQFKLPATATPSFTTVTHELGWKLVATSGSFLGAKVAMAIPLEIVDASAAATTERLREAPRVADERVATIFAGFAARRGWTVAPDDERAAERPVIERQTGDAVLRIGYAYRGQDGTVLVARLSHAPLGLGLTVEPSSSLRHVFFRDIEIDIDAWDRAHHVGARSAEQARPLLAAAVPSVLAATRTLGHLVRWTDDGMVFERPIATVELGHLEETAGVLEHLDAAIEAALPAIGPPTGLTVDVQAWRQLADRWNGRLTVGELAIEGELDRVPVEVGLVWDETRPIAVRAHVGSPAQASGVARAVTMSLPRPAADSLGEPAAAQLVEKLIDWPTDIYDLKIADGVASASWAIANDAADAKRVQDLVDKLRAILAVLDPGAGPYR